MGKGGGLPNFPSSSKLGPQATSGRGKGNGIPGIPVAPGPIGPGQMQGTSLPGLVSLPDVFNLADLNPSPHGRKRPFDQAMGGENTDLGLFFGVVKSFNTATG